MMERRRIERSQILEAVVRRSMDLSRSLIKVYMSRCDLGILIVASLVLVFIIAFSISQFGLVAACSRSIPLYRP
jgi:hypothetical protein